MIRLSLLICKLSLVLMASILLVSSRLILAVEDASCVDPRDTWNTTKQVVLEVAAGSSDGEAITEAFVATYNEYMACDAPYFRRLSGARWVDTTASGAMVLRVYFSCANCTAESLSLFELLAVAEEQKDDASSNSTNGTTTIISIAPSSAPTTAMHDDSPCTCRPKNSTTISLEGFLSQLEASLHDDTTTIVANMVELQTVSCEPEDLTNFTSSAYMDVGFTGEPSPEDLRALEASFVEAYNTLAFGVCDPYFRSLLGAELEIRDGATAVFSVRGRCRGCSVASSPAGSFPLFDDNAIPQQQADHLPSVLFSSALQEQITAAYNKNQEATCTCNVLPSSPLLESGVLVSQATFLRFYNQRLRENAQQQKALQHIVDSIQSIEEFREVDCGGPTKSFRSEVFTDLRVDLNTITQEEVEVLETVFLNAYNRLSYQSCDGYFRTIQKVELRRVQHSNRRLQPSHSSAGASATTSTTTANSTTQAAGTTRHSAVVPTLFAVTGECRGCPVSSSGVFNLFDDAIQRGWRRRGLEEEDSSSWTAPILGEETCTCPVGEEPSLGEGPTAEDFESVLVARVDQLQEEGKVAAKSVQGVPENVLEPWVSASPSVAPSDGPPDDLVHVSLHYGFGGKRAREATEDEVKDLVCVTNLFYRDLLRKHTNDDTVEVEAIHVDWAYDASSVQPVVVRFLLDVTRNGYQDKVHQDTVLEGSELTTSKHVEYIQNYVWETPIDSLFQEVESSSYSNTVNDKSRIKKWGKLARYSCSPTQAPSAAPSMPATASVAPTITPALSHSAIFPDEPTVSPMTMPTSVPSLPPSPNDIPQGTSHTFLSSEFQFGLYSGDGVNNGPSSTGLSSGSEVNNGPSSTGGVNNGASYATGAPSEPTVSPMPSLSPAPTHSPTVSALPTVTPRPTTLAEAMGRVTTQEIRIVHYVSNEDRINDVAAIRAGLQEAWPVFVQETLAGIAAAGTNKGLRAGHRRLAIELAQGSEFLDEIMLVECPERAKNGTTCHTVSSSYLLLLGDEDNPREVAQEYGTATIGAADDGRYQDTLERLEPKTPFTIGIISAPKSQPEPKSDDGMGLSLWILIIGIILFAVCCLCILLAYSCTKEDREREEMDSESDDEDQKMLVYDFVITKEPPAGAKSTTDTEASSAATPATLQSNTLLWNK